MSDSSRPWLFFAMLTVLCWGIWGALIEIPEKAGFPATLGYCIWSITMIIPAAVVLTNNGWQIDARRSTIIYGMVVGLFGAAGQLILFQALRNGPAYIIFPLVSLSPLLTIILSYFRLRETASVRSWVGIGIAILAMPLLSYQGTQGNHQGYMWFLLSMIVFICWGTQAYFMKVASRDIHSSSIFSYMAISALTLMPFALLMTDFNQPINWGFSGPLATAGIQLLNSIGALFILYAFRYGKAIIVSPLINAGAPIITIILSLFLYTRMPGIPLVSGILLAVISIFLMSGE